MRKYLLITILLMTVISLGTPLIVKYTIQSGDTLYGISKNFNVNLSIILDWNSGKIDPLKLKIGDVLQIPQPAGYQYTVKEGDSLYRISRKYFTTVSDLKTDNSLRSDILYVGQKIFISAESAGIAFNDSKKFMWPVYGVISSDYGWRIHPLKHIRAFHTGIDIAAEEGTPIFSSCSGTVTFVGFDNSGYGNMVKVSDGRIDVIYGHMSAFAVVMGEHVKQGDLIGRVGSTGLSTGPHCHFEIRLNGSHTNPRAYVPPYGEVYALKSNDNAAGGE